MRRDVTHASHKLSLLRTSPCNYTPARRRALWPQVLGGLSAEQLDDRSAVERQLYKAGVKVEGGSSLLS